MSVILTYCFWSGSFLRVRFFLGLLLLGKSAAAGLVNPVSFFLVFTGLGSGCLVLGPPPPASFFILRIPCFILERGDCLGEQDIFPFLGVGETGGETRMFSKASSSPTRPGDDASLLGVCWLGPFRLPLLPREDEEDLRLKRNGFGMGTGGGVPTADFLIS